MTASVTYERTGTVETFVRGQTINDILRQAIEAEWRAHDFYSELAEMFTDVDDEVADFWAELAQDETDHAGELERIRESCNWDQLGRPADAELIQSAGAVRALLATDLRDRIRTLDDAYELAHKLEFSEVNSLFQVLALEFVSSEDRRNFVASEMKLHREKLLAFGKEIGDREQRRKVIAERFSAQFSD